MGLKKRLIQSSPGILINNVFSSVFIHAAMKGPPPGFLRRIALFADRKAVVRPTRSTPRPTGNQALKPLENTGPITLRTCCRHSDAVLMTQFSTPYRAHEAVLQHASKTHYKT